LSYFGLARPVPSRRLPASRRAQLDLRTALTAGDEATVSYERRERLSWRSPELHLLRRYARPKGRLPIDTNKTSGSKNAEGSNFINLVEVTVTGCTT
jgi:hypothetical protein